MRNWIVNPPDVTTKIVENVYHRSSLHITEKGYTDNSHHEENLIYLEPWKSSQQQRTHNTYTHRT